MPDTRTERLNTIADDYFESQGLYTVANSIRGVAVERDGYRQQCVECLVTIGKLRDANDALVAALKRTADTLLPDDTGFHVQTVGRAREIAIAALAAVQP
jgi:hypothetical protein